MNIQLAIAGVIAAASFGGAWAIQDWRYGAKEKERVEEELAQVQADAATAIRRADNIIVAQNEATALERSLRRSVAANRDALVRLSDAAEAALGTAAASHSACLDRAAAFKEVFGQCSREYVGLGEKADRHAIDIRALTKSSLGCFATEDKK
jgi:hypothetical protein